MHLLVGRGGCYDYFVYHLLIFQKEDFPTIFHIVPCGGIFGQNLFSSCEGGGGKILDGSFAGFPLAFGYTKLHAVQKYLGGFTPSLLSLINLKQMLLEGREKEPSFEVSLKSFLGSTHTH